jgi:hypothetical protein
MRGARAQWIDRENMLCCMEAGIVGIDCKRRLQELGCVLCPRSV